MKRYARIKVFCLLFAIFAFLGFLGLGSLTIVAEEQAVLEYTLNDDGQSYSVDGSSSYNQSRVFIPETYNGLPVTKIKDYAFQNNDYIMEVLLSKNVERVGAYAFTYCENIRTIAVSAENPYYYSTNNCLIQTGTNKLVLGCQSSIIPSNKNITCIGKAAFLGCKNLKKITIPDSVTEIENTAFHNCSALEEIQLSANLEKIGTIAFMHCGALREILLPSSLTTIGQGAFSYCTSFTKVSVPANILSIEARAFGNCTGLKDVILSNGIRHVESTAFLGCSELVNIELPYSLRSIGYCAFEGCTNLENVLYHGVQTDWQQIAVDEENDCLTNALIYVGNGTTEDLPPLKDGFVLFSDVNNTSVKIGNTLTVGVAEYANGKRVTDLSGITFSITDNSIVNPVKTTVKKNNFYVELSAQNVGRTFISFSSSTLGHVIQVPITAFQDNLHSYTLSSMPSEKIEKYTSNLYNVNGLYVDEYKYEVNGDGSANVSFDVYNTNHIFGTVEVYDANHTLKDVIVIDKMQKHATDIKESVWDNAWFLIKDAHDGDFLTYRQESGFSKHTPVSVILPKGGYLTINMDTNLFFPCLINVADMFTDIADLMGKLKNTPDSKIFSDALTKKILLDETAKELFKNRDEVVKTLNKNIAKPIFTSKESMGSFFQTFAKNISSLNVDEILMDTVSDLGCSMSENIFTYLAGPAGVALKGIFFLADCGNLVAQIEDFTQAHALGVIVLQNQGGGIRAVSEIKVESDADFAEDVALNVFTLSLSSDAMQRLKFQSPDLYTKLRDNPTYTYNISLLKNGQEVQPSHAVSVYIPIPSNLSDYRDNVKIYRMEEDGTLAEMETTVQGNCLVFTTNHFSIYTLVADTVDTAPPVCDFLEYSYEYLESGTLRLTEYFGSDTFVRLPNVYNGYPVTHIGNRCFENVKTLEEIIIPDSIKAIEENAFVGCNALQKIYYIGSETEWAELEIAPSNDLSNVKIIYDCEFENGILILPSEEEEIQPDENTDVQTSSSHSWILILSILFSFLLIIPFIILIGTVLTMIIIIVIKKKRK